MMVFDTGTVQPNPRSSQTKVAGMKTSPGVGGEEHHDNSTILSTHLPTTENDRPSLCTSSRTVLVLLVTEVTAERGPLP